MKKIGGFHSKLIFIIFFCINYYILHSVLDGQLENCQLKLVGQVDELGLIDSYGRYRNGRETSYQGRASQEFLQEHLSTSPVFDTSYANRHGSSRENTYANSGTQYADSQN